MKYFLNENGNIFLVENIQVYRNLIEKGARIWIGNVSFVVKRIKVDIEKNEIIISVKDKEALLIYENC